MYLFSFSPARAWLQRQLQCGFYILFSSTRSFVLNEKDQVYAHKNRMGCRFTLAFTTIKTMPLAQ
jgi:hypothetical protein